MKKWIYFLSIVFFLLSIQCSNEIPTSTETESMDIGKVSLKIDKLNVPSRVVLVEASLTNSEDSIYGALNILSSTTADILFENVEAGDWHLKVDAKDSLGVVLYTGETDVSVNAGILTNVNLTLIPTGNGFGSIYISVNWGVNPKWTDYPANPIISPSIIPDNPLALFHPKIIYENGLYKMWVTCVYYSAHANIWYLISSDGINWELGHNLPVLSQGDFNSWDSHMVGSSVVIKEDNFYKMYYNGFADQNDYWHIGLATSSDGINWMKYPNPILYAGNDEFQIGPNEIIKIDGKYFLYYTDRHYPSYNIRLAVSQDGINFIRSYKNPILSPEENWEGTGILSPSIIFEDNKYKIIYASVNSSGTGLGMAYSTDGINWTKDLNNPFFKIDDVQNNWCTTLAYPFWRKIDNHYRIYYTGNTRGYSSDIGMIYK